MSDYSRQKDFSAKDALSTGNPNKVIKGSDVDAEFDAIVTATASKANKVTSPTAGNLITMDSDGDLVDAGQSASSAGAHNIVINPRFVVNQRGAASRTATGSAYNVDRWYYDGTALYQGIENADIEDTTYSASWTSDATLEYQLVSTATAAAAVASAWSGTSVSNGTSFTLASSSGKNLWLRFAAGGDGLASLDQCQVAKGATAPDYVERAIAHEVTLCLRYFQTHQVFAECGTATDTNAYYCIWPLQVPMRAAPTIGNKVNTHAVGFAVTTATWDDISAIHIRGYRTCNSTVVNGRWGETLETDAEL